MAIALNIPPRIPCIPWRLCTPHVSYNPIEFSSLACKYLKAITQTNPEKSPMHKAAEELVNIPHAAPIATPPAKVAFRMSSMHNFYLKKAVVINAPKQLPVRDKIVLLIITLVSYGEFWKYPALNDGQNIQRKRVPIMEKIFKL
jgi:hypothetical protein